MLFYSNQNSYTETLTEVITNGAASLYEKMVKDFTNETMTNAAAESSTNLLPCQKSLNTVLQLIGPETPPI